MRVSLIEAVVGAVQVPVTLKMRLGWDDASATRPSSRAAPRAAGMQLITVHAPHALPVLQRQRRLGSSCAR